MKYPILKVQAGVRYWEDATVNGHKDTEGDLIPFRKGDYWCPSIDLRCGKVIDWPEGLTASIYYKVCDDGEYWLADESGVPMLQWSGCYVPNDFLCHGDSGYGDYIILKISEDGSIAKWKEPDVSHERWEPLTCQQEDTP